MQGIPWPIIATLMEGFMFCVNMLQAGLFTGLVAVVAPVVLCEILFLWWEKIMLLSLFP